MLAMIPVPVRSCWNGMVAFSAGPFLGEHGVRFRGVDDRLAAKHVEGSECCLVHYDNEKGEGVWVNPDVRVGYSEQAYEAVREWPDQRGRWRGWGVGIVTGVLRLPWRGDKMGRRARAWGREVGSREVGQDCLVDEMQILVGNGWKHV